MGAAHADQAFAKKIDLELISQLESVPVVMQPELMSEALGNLIDNAIRYTQAGGRIMVEVLTGPTRIRVSDSGPGIAEDERELVFERFVRGRLAIGDGSGLGLAIVRDIAALHGASVALSDSAWGGTRATISFSRDSSA